MENLFIRKYINFTKLIHVLWNSYYNPFKDE